MADPTLQQLIASTPPDQLWDLLTELSPAERAALEEALPPSQVEYLDAPGPVDLARRLHPGWRDRPHLDLISARFVHASTHAGRLIVNVPPQHGKSQLVSRWGPAWYLDRWPGRRVILTSYAERLARGRSREVRDTFLSSAGLHTRVRRGAATQTEWETVDGGGMIARGLRGAVTGYGATLFIIDDPFAGWEDAHSRAERDRVWNFWRAVAGTRLSPLAAVVLVMTRWHEDDLAGRLLSDEWEGDPDEWELLRIPALSEGDGDPLGRAEGMPLIRPDVDMTVEEAGAWLEGQRRERGPYLWNGLYQQVPGSPEGAIFRRGWWQYYRTAEPGVGQTRPDRGASLWAVGDRVDVAGMRVVQSWDMSFKDAADTSYVVGQVWGVHPSRPGDRWLLDQTRDRMGFSASKAAMLRLRARWPSTTATWVEDKANGPAIVDDLRRSISGLVPVSPQGSKESRAWACQGDVQAGNVWIPSPEACPWVRDWVDELADFPHGAHDDQVDAFTQAILRLRSQGAGRSSRPTGRVPGVRAV